LSVLAPVGTAILGQRVGDELKWRVPSGWRRFKVQRVVSQPEREGLAEDEPNFSLPAWLAYESRHQESLSQQEA
jgi:hypothetical protein